MAECGRCGAAGRQGRFCTRCGSALPEAGVSLRKDPLVGPAEPTVTGPPSNWAATASYPVPPPMGPHPEPSRHPARRRGAAALVAVAVAVLLVAGAAIWLLRPDGPDGGGTAVGVSGTAVPPTGLTTAAGTTEPAATPGRPVPAGPAGGKDVVTPSSVPVVTLTAVATTTVAADPMGGPRADIACGSGYIVQVASELDQAAFTGRVAALRAAGQLPAGVKWTETSASCPIFSNQANVIVLYAGPFATVADACPARLTSPADAFVKQADAAAVGTFRACLCPAAAGDIPAITTVGQTGAWVGELQRVLGAGLDYEVGSINADPSVGDPGRWGIYTDETAAAVGRFQTDHGLAATRQVDATTWSALQSAWCGQE